MGKAKSLIIKPISSNYANRIVKSIHYSGKIVNNSMVHFGVYLDNVLFGAMQFGCPMDKRRVIGLVKGTKWNEMLELNRMAFHDLLPKNSESRALSIAFKILKKKYPYLKWILSYSDATQCGDGAIYRASGFVLTSIKKNSTIYKLKDGTIISDKSLKNINNLKMRGGYKKPDGAKKLEGFQLRYIYFLDKKCRKDLAVPEIPFSKIVELNAQMYKGNKCVASKDSVATDDQSVEGGASPTAMLQ